MFTDDTVCVHYQVRSLAAVLLRRLFTTMTDDTWSTIPEPIQTTVKEQLLIIVQQEQLPMLRKKICDVIAELARNMLGECSRILN